MADPVTLTLPDDRLLAWSVTGDPDGLPVLWLDGTPGSRVPWLVPHGVRLATFDRPGYGGSDPRPGRSVLDVAEDVRHLLDHLGWSRCHLVGFSNGGPHALATASHLGARVLGIIAIGSASPSPSAGTTAGRQATARALAEDPRAYRRELEEVARMVRADPLPTMLAGFDEVAPRDREMVTRLAGTFEHAMRTATTQGAAGWFDDHVAVHAPDWGVAWSGVTCPVVFLHGGRDVICPLDSVERLAALLPDATVEVDPEDGHFSPLGRLEGAIVRHWLPAGAPPRPGL